MASKLNYFNIEMPSKQAEVQLLPGFSLREA
jgi:hypothetical protein